MKTFYEVLDVLKFSFVSWDIKFSSLKAVIKVENICK